MPSDHPGRPAALLALAAAAAFALPGCLGGDGWDFEPGTGYKPTGRTVHLKMTVVDLFEHKVFPGYGADLWAFCVEPFDAGDAYSKAAIRTYPRLEGDGVGTDGMPLPEHCSVPGPTIVVKQGDTVKVEFSHSHVHPHTIHWHGQFVPWESDGAPGVAQDSVNSGQSFTYEFEAKRAGTLWYHCHVDTQLHVMQGLYGMFIVEPQSKKHEPKGIDREHTLVFSTLNAAWVWEGNPNHAHPAGCGTSGTQGCENPPIEAEADVFMVNGHSYPWTMEEGTLIKIAEGERIRLRLLNAGTTVETIHPHGHDMLVTHRDGNPLEAPYWVDTLTIGPAERYDVVIEGNNPGPWMIHTHVNDHETNCGKAPGGMHTMIVYEGFEDQMHSKLAELPATCDFQPPRPISPDVVRSQANELGTNPTVDTDLLTVPVTPVCTVRGVTFSVSLSTVSGPLAQLSELAIELRDPNGDVLAGADLGGQAGSTATLSLPSGQATLRSLVPGNYTLHATGRTLEATVAASAVVDHFESYALADHASHTATGPVACTDTFALPGSAIYGA